MSPNKVSRPKSLSLPRSDRGGSVEYLRREPWRGSRDTRGRTVISNGDEHRPSFGVRSTEVIKAYAAFESRRFAFTLVPEKRPIAGFDLRTVHTRPRILIPVYDCVRARQRYCSPRGIVPSSEILTAIDRPVDRPIGSARAPRYLANQRAP